MALQSDTRWVIVERDWISEEIIRVVEQISEDDDYGWRVARDRVNDHDQQLLNGRPGWADSDDGSWELLDVTKVGPETLELLNWLCRFDFSE